LARLLVAPLAPTPTAASLLFVIGARLLWPVSLTFLPAALAIAVLRYRLFAIKVLVNRALVYGTLTTLVAALYVLIVGGLSALLQTSTPLAPVAVDGDRGCAVDSLIAPPPAARDRPLNVWRGRSRTGPNGRSDCGCGHRPRVATPAQPTPTPPAIPARPRTAAASVWDGVFRILAGLAVVETAGLAVSLILAPTASG
jgi:hypothetical protein